MTRWGWISQQRYERETREMATITQAQAQDINESCKNICNLIEEAQQLTHILMETGAAGSRSIKGILATIHDNISESAGEASGIQERIAKLIQGDKTESHIRDMITQKQIDERRVQLYSMVKHFGRAEDKSKVIELIDGLTDDEIGDAIRSKQAIEIESDGGRVTIRTLETGVF